MRSNKNSRNIDNHRSERANQRLNQPHRYSDKARKGRNINDKKRKSKVKIMTEGKIKRNRLRNKLILIAYAVFSVYVIITYMNWQNMVKPMMKNEHSVVMDSSGNIVATLGAERNSNNVTLEKIPDNLKNAYIDIEDERFYSHRGVDVKRTVGAIGTYITHFGKSSFGGSTITQQLVKNLTGNDDTSIARKVQEWLRATELEMFSTKDEILEAYFNIIYLGPNTYGVNAAAKYYFNKDVENLDLAECAYLAGINNSPNTYNPFGDKDNSEKIKKRAKTVLKKMLDKNHINNEDYQVAVAEIDNGLQFKNGDSYKTADGIYSYHTDAVISELVSDISKDKHVDTKFATNYLYMAGLKIYSTEDASIQKKLEDEYNKKQHVITSSSTGSSSQSAMVIIDHKNGQVVACVGGLGKKTTSRGFNRATQGCRQTGSASKPLAVLIPGISEKLFTVATLYNDEPTRFEDGTEEGYNPTDNADYIGEITVRRAVESSQNIPFVKMMEQITPKKSIKYLKKMGITSLQEKDESLMLALGGLEKGITPLEMAGAYATIANDGEYIEPTFYTKVESLEGKTVMKSRQDKRRVISKEVAYIIKDLLKQPVEGDNGTAKACRIDGMDVAAKTGTTNDNYDKWLCGFTTYYTGVTWYGYDKNESIEYRGKSPAVVLWSSVMKSVHSNLEKTRFEKNTNLKQATICAKTGKTATTNCSDTYTDYFLSGTVPDQCTSCSGSSKNTNKKSNQTTTQNTSKQSTSTENKTENSNENDNTSANNNASSNTNTSTNNVSNNVTNADSSNSNKANSNSTKSGANNNQNTDNKSNNNTNTSSENTKTNRTNTNSSGGNSGNSSNNISVGNTNIVDDDEHDDGP